MAIIHVLSSETINRIAAGEVVERPVNVVKELVENSIDAGASAVTIEIKNGGIDLIRVTDNGCGIESDQITRAFRRHATSKITDERDLMNLSTLGFRGEALSSIAAVSQVEMITKTHDSLTGTHATNEVLKVSGAKAGDAADAGAASLQTTDIIPLDITEVGAPDGTTVIVRNIFYNVPVRKKFLRTPQTEAGYITDLVEHLAMSHPDISFHYRVNNQEKLHTTGNGNEKELIYRIYGREMANSVIPINVTAGDYNLEGYLGRPEFSRSSRSYEIFFVNGRILRSDVLSKALEEGYRTDLMQHRFPFAILHLNVPTEEIDVNVHPSKMEVRFTNAKGIYDFINEGVHATLHQVEMIPRATFASDRDEQKAHQEEVKTREAAFAAEPHTEQFEAGQMQARGEQIRMPDFARAGSSPAAAGTGAVSVADSVTENSTAADNERDAVNGNAGSFLRESSGAQRYESAVDSSSASHSGASSVPESLTPDGNQEETANFVFDDRRESSSAPKANPFLAEDHSKELLGEQADASGHFEQGALFQEEKPATDPGAGDGSASSVTDSSTPASPAGIDALMQEAAKDSSYGPDLHFHYLSQEHVKEWRIVGQVFKTYWIVEFRDKMLMIDQHAAHEKVNFERLMKRLTDEQNSPAASQMLAPPIVVNLTGREEGAYEQYQDYFRQMGYEIEPFGENSYAIHAVPLELYANEPDALLREILDEILDEKMSGTPAAILYKIASMSCKAAIKGNSEISRTEAEALIGELLSLDNPYHCPHGRPTMIVLSETDLEKKFKRIV